MSTPLSYDDIRVLEAKLNAAIKEVAEANGFNVTPVNIKFASTEFECRMRFSTKESNPTGVDPRYKRDLVTRGKTYGLLPEMIGTRYKGTSGELEFIGMRATKAILRDNAGEIYTASATTIAPHIISAYSSN